DIFGPEFDKNRLELKTLQDYVKLYGNRGPEFEPGSRWQYSNYGFLLLGVIIEKVSGQDYYDYVRDHIFKPAGMQNSEWYEADKPTVNVASGYTQQRAEAGKRRNNIYSRPARGTSAGGGYSTAEDLLKYSLALQSGKLRLPNFRESSAASTQQPSGSKASGFGGLGIAGGAPGINAVLEANTGSGYTLVVMSNYDPPSAEQFAKQIRGWLARIGK